MIRDRHLGRLAMPGSIGRTRLAAASALALTALALAGGWAALAVAAVVVAIAALAATRTRRPAATTVGALERLSSVSVAPGASIHAVRFRDRVLVVGASQAGLTVLDRVEDDATSCVAGPSRVRPMHSPWLAVVVLASIPGTSPGAQADSTQQRVELEQPAAVAPSPAPEDALPVPPVAPVGQVDDARPVAGVVVWLSAVALLPFMLMAVTSFVKTTVVLSLLRNGLGTPQVPSDPVLAGIALALTSFVMAPVAAEAAQRVRDSGADTSSAAGAVAAVAVAAEPVRAFMLRNTRPAEIALFVELSASHGGPAARPDAFEVLVPAFVTSELRRAFIAGFFVLVPFLVVDLVVSNILMSMGMVMVSPATVSLPFKIMLFVLVDGWPQLMKGLALSYH